jgi:hypothetical protein
MHVKVSWANGEKAARYGRISFSAHSVEGAFILSFCKKQKRKDTKL